VVHFSHKKKANHALFKGFKKVKTIKDNGIIQNEQQGHQA